MAGGGQWDGVRVYRRNSRNTLVIRGLICNFRCKNNPVQAECSNKAMLVDSHTQNSKHENVAEMQGFIRYVKTFEFVGARSNQATEIGGSHYQHGMQFAAVPSTHLY